MQLSRIRQTGFPLDKLSAIGIKMATIPETVSIHPQLAKIFKARKETIVSGAGIDWGTAESLAFGALLLEGNHVRLTGQDVQRGTFSHRHAVVIDQKTGESYTPLNHLAKYALPQAPLNKNEQPPDVQAEFTCRNSILSEYGVLGFEMGYSLENPNTLVLWEAQFGDFVNGAQVIIYKTHSAFIVME
jgi:2-oxoglutarate dehydrogenase E1 component